MQRQVYAPNLVRLTHFPDSLSVEAMARQASAKLTQFPLSKHFISVPQFRFYSSTGWKKMENESSLANVENTSADIVKHLIGKSAFY